eukprot:EG_transcript_14650
MQTVNVKKELFEAIPKEFQDGELLSRIHADSEANAALLLSYITKGNPPTVVVNILKGKKGKKTAAPSQQATDATSEMFIDDACISPLKLRSAANEEIVGTCFRFREVVLTADHCVRDDKQLLPGTFIAWDKQLIYRGSLETMDVAVFSEEVTSTNSFQSFARAKEGELVQARGYPQVMADEGYQSISQFHGQIVQVGHNSAVAIGTGFSNLSGAPVFNRRGLIGLSTLCQEETDSEEEGPSETWDFAERCSVKDLAHYTTDNIPQQSAVAEFVLASQFIFLLQEYDLLLCNSEVLEKYSRRFKKPKR